MRIDASLLSLRSESGRQSLHFFFLPFIILFLKQGRLNRHTVYVFVFERDIYPRQPRDIRWIQERCPPPKQHSIYCRIYECMYACVCVCVSFAARWAPTKRDTDTRKEKVRSTRKQLQETGKQNINKKKKRRKKNVQRLGWLWWIRCCNPVVSYVCGLFILFFFSYFFFSKQETSALHHHHHHQESSCFLSFSTKSHTRAMDGSKRRGRCLSTSGYCLTWFPMLPQWNRRQKVTKAWLILVLLPKSKFLEA